MHIFILCQLANSIITEKRICFKIFTDLHDNVTENGVHRYIFTVKNNDKPIKCIMINLLSNKSCLV